MIIVVRYKKFRVAPIFGFNVPFPLGDGFKMLLNLGSRSLALSLLYMSLALTLVLPAEAAPLQRSPSEVLLVYNSASPTSTAVANYYAAQRGVTNVLAVNCQDSALNAANETISFSNYKSQIQNPISNYLAAHPGISFIVLTKGI